MKPIRTGLAAFGLSGKVFHAPFLLSNPAFELVAVLERSKNESAVLSPAPRIERSFESLLADDSIELIVVNGPSGLHFEMAQQALLAGKHVVVEKPFTDTLEQAQTLIALAEQKNLLLSVYHNRRLESGYLTIKQLLQWGTLGRISSFKTCVDRYRPKLGHKVWKEQANPAAGLLYDFGSHMVDEALTLFGRPKSIYADIRSQRDGAGAPDYFMLRFDYDNQFGQFSAEMSASMLALAPSPHYVVHGDKGSYVKHIADIQEDKILHGAKPLGAHWCNESETDWGLLYSPEGVAPYASINGAYHSYYQNIAEALRGDAPLAVTAPQAAAVIELLQLAKQSAAQGRTIAL